MNGLCRFRWALKGDENSRFFHSILNNSYAKYSIKGMYINGVWIDSPGDIKQVALDHYASLLESDFSLNEVKDAVWEWGVGYKAPRPNGFNFNFTIAYWDVVLLLSNIHSCGRVAAQYKRIHRTPGVAAIISSIGSRPGPYTYSYTGSRPSITDTPHLRMEQKQINRGHVYDRIHPLSENYQWFVAQSPEADEDQAGEVVMELMLFGACPHSACMHRGYNYMYFLRGSDTELFCIIIAFKYRMETYDTTFSCVTLHKVDMSCINWAGMERLKKWDLTGLELEEPFLEQEDANTLYRSRKLWEKMEDLKDANFFMDLARDNSVVYTPTIASAEDDYPKSEQGVEDKDREIMDLEFWNLFTNAFRNLPGMAGFRFYWLCFLAPPTSPNCMVVGFGEEGIYIHFVGGEKSWRLVSLDYDDDDYPFHFYFPTLYGQDLYALDSGEELHNGNGHVSVITETNEIIKVLPPKTAKEVMARERERKARTTLLMALLEDHLAKFHKMVDAKEMWEAIKSRFEGLHKGYDMFQTLLSQLEIHGAGVSHKDPNQKFLKSLPSFWSQVALIMITKPGLDTLSFDDLYNHLRVFKRDVKGTTASSSNTLNVAFMSAENTNNTNDVSTAYSVSSPYVSKSKKEGSSSYTDEVIHSFFENQSSAPQLDYDDLEQINDDDIEEIDLKWQVAMIFMRIKKFHKRTGRKLQFDTKDPVGFDKTKEECFKCHIMGHFARDCRAKGNQDSKRRDVGNNENKTRDNGRRPAYQDDSKALVTIDVEDID
uniref:CCHC-type domain-containing protein n=1 Tax=Tanacetum cinerariifolium TaxID=118510 RepID=A0A6L2MVV2_TANCI|nr:hypothetical protein [Tanacetum cinerariifolium]